MGFVITSVSNVNNVAANVLARSNELRAVITNIASDLNVLKYNIDGYGTGEALRSLSDQLGATGMSLSAGLDRIATFINTQAKSYQQNEEEAVNALTDIESALSSISIGDEIL